MNFKKVPGTVRFYCISNTKPMIRGSSHATGYDVAIRAIVSHEPDPHSPYRRKNEYGFDCDTTGTRPIYHNEKENRFEYVLMPGRVVTVGLGVVLGMDPGWTAFVTRRSSTAINDIILPDQVQEMMFGVPIDADFRGEPIARLKNLGDEDFHIWQGQRLLQLIFFDGQGKGPVIPWLYRVYNIEELGETVRGCRMHGSSGP